MIFIDNNCYANFFFNFEKIPMQQFLGFLYNFTSPRIFRLRPPPDIHDLAMYSHIPYIYQTVLTVRD